MSDQENKKKADAADYDARINNEDFQFVLKALLAAYHPIVEEASRLSKDPERLKKEAEGRRPNCEEEFALARRIFDKFLTRDVALRLVPEKNRQQFESGPSCLDYIVCCLIFGWLFCRGFGTFRVSAQYMYRYWLCVRQALGIPISNPPTDEQRRDFQTLVQALASAYKPYLTDQLATVEFPAGLPGEVLEGRIDCLEGKAEAGAVIRRFLSADTSEALLGKNAHSKLPPLCRCYCLCAIEFGCCLANVVSLTDLIWCLIDFFVCVEDCFQPLICTITDPAPNSCAEAIFVVACSPLIGIEIKGTAAGLSFNHYTLQYSWGGGSPQNDAVVYSNCNRPPGQTSSNVAVFGGTLGYLDVTLLPPGVAEFTVYVDVFDSGAGHVQCTQTFKVRTTAIEIQAAAKVNALVAEDPFNLGTFPKLIKAVNNPNPSVPELSIGGSFSVDGSAYTVGCDRIISQFVLVSFGVNPTIPVPAFPDATGGTQLVPSQPVPYDDNPGHPWQSGCFPVITPNIILNGDLVATWATLNCTFLGINYTVPKVLPVPFWDSTPLNGRFVILLEVRDRALPAGAFPGSVAGVDQVVVWIDNQVPIAQIKSIGGITGCGDLHLKDYVGTTAEILGVAWDPPIVGLVPPKRPDDNFGSYSMGFEKNGDPLAVGAIPPAISATTRVPNIWPGPLGGAIGTLANWDIVAALDGGAGPLPPNSPKLLRGDRCAYVVTLSVSDTTHVGDSGINHSTGPVLYAITVINDIV